MKEKPRIVLPEDKAKRKALEDKLIEYKGRLSRFKEDRPYVSPELAARIRESYIDSLCKVAITERLLERGEVDTRELFEELKEREGPILLSDYYSAVNVIADYCETGGRKTIGGTGFLPSRRSDN